MEPLIAIEGLCRHYGDHCAVQGLDFELHRGEVLGLLGPNGAGKSTTLRMIAGNLAPSGGRIRVNGADLLQDPLRAKAAIGYLPEIPPLYRELSVDEFLRHCARLHHISRQSLDAAVQRAKACCGLESTGRRLIDTLSKGYRQRVGIAQAIIHNPPVVILDEPTVGLDPIQIREIRELIRELGREHGVILSTHILPEVQALCSRVLILDQGTLVYSGCLHGAGEDSVTLRIRLEQPPPETALTALSGVARAECLESGGYRLWLEEGQEASATLTEQLVQSGWGLLEFTPERQGLEQIFAQLIAGEGSGA